MQVAVIAPQARIGLLPRIATSAVRAILASSLSLPFEQVTARRRAASLVFVLGAEALDARAEAAFKVIFQARAREVYRRSRSRTCEAGMID